ncbi:MAG: hypothetical protein IH914_04325 [candidate division Zixibacteria bacterium]|nr:hypothetical protein [candidate division Zixibacteria bacterium]
MRKLILIIVASVSLVTFGGCEDNALVDLGADSVVGIILDSLSLAPIDSVGIRLNDTAIPAPFFFTDSAGNFRAETGFGERLQIIHFSKTGYITKTMARAEILSAINSDVAAKDSLVVLLKPETP